MAAGVLLADDDPQARSALRLLIEHEPGVRVIGEAGAAADLLARLRRTRPCLVLLDWDLPGLDPSAFVAEARACCPDMAVIALSTRPEAAVAARAVGVDDFVCKGDTPDRLLELVRRSGHGPAADGAGADLLA